MKPIRDLSVTIMKAAIITVATVLGFGFGSVVGLPVWLQGFCLIPAMLLFYRLAGSQRPTSLRIFAFTALLSVFVFLLTWASKYVPQQDIWYYYMLILLIAPFGPIVNWFERRFCPKEDKF